MKLEVNIQALEAIRNREVNNRDVVPEHTLDWYTYDNRVKLIDEIADSFIQVVRVKHEEVADSESTEAPSAKKKLSAKKQEAIAEKVVAPLVANAGDPTDDLPKQS